LRKKCEQTTQTGCNCVDEFFQKKYGMAFSEFEKTLRSSDEERFEMKNDYLVWKFACDGISSPNPEPRTPNLEP
jgi:hypothetical protein